jgi:MFS family permease
VAVAEHLGFALVFVVGGAMPLLAALFVPAIRVPAGDRPQAPEPRPVGPMVRSASAPVLAMLTCSTAQGGLITFLPLAVAGGGLVVVLALLGTAAGSLVGRLVAGELVDRHGWGGRLLRPGILLSAAGMATEAVVIGTGAGALVVVGAVVVGFGFGLVQNDAMTDLFAAAGPSRYGSASAAWNVAYDTGTGVGSVGLGAVAEPFGYPAAFGVSTALLLMAGAVRRRRAKPAKAGASGPFER